MTNNDEKGFSLISLIIVLAIIFALLNVYSYYNPSFSLAKYSPLNLLRGRNDKTRIADLAKLEAAIKDYYDQHNQLPGFDGWCGRMSTVLHPELAVALEPYFSGSVFPHDPTNGNTNKDYFYYRVDRSRFILMAATELHEDDGGNGNFVYNFKNCHDWPGDDVYNYQVRNF